METSRLKQERIVEAVRRGLDGMAAVEFLHHSGYAMTTQGIARHLRAMGGRGRLEGLIAEGSSNREVIALLFPETDFGALPQEMPSQGELFAEDAMETHALDFAPTDEMFDTTRITARIPSDVYEALRIAAKVEGKSQSQLLGEILSHHLSRLPRRDAD